MPWGKSIHPVAKRLPRLIKGVDDRAQEVRWYSADSLGRLGPAAKEAVPTLLAGVKDPANDLPFKRTAAQSFGRIGAGSEEAVPWLVEALRESDPPLKVAAALALWRSERSAHFPHSRSHSRNQPAKVPIWRAWHFWNWARKPGRRAPALVKTLGHESADARRAAARVWASWGRR